MKPEVAKKRAKLKSADQPPRSLLEALRFNLANLLFLLAGMGLAALLLKFWPTNANSGTLPTNPATAAAPTPTRGPWGELELTRFSLQEPAPYLPDVHEKIPAARWVFEKYTTDQLTALFQSLEVTPGTRARLLDRSQWQVLADGVVLHPSRELLHGLTQRARQQLYPLLGESRHNFSHFYPFRFRAGGFEDWFKDSGLPSEALEFVRDLTYTNRTGALCLVDIALLQERLTPHEYSQLLQSLYSEPSVLLSLRVRPTSDLPSLAAYWGRGGREQEVLAILRSLSHVPGGGSISVSHLLPPFARTRLYTHHSDTNSPVNEQDCYWTSANFFRRDPDPRLAAGVSPHDILISDYEESRERPRLGDVLLVMERQKPVHACVYIADDVVFTKNGANYHQPWILMQLADMLARYSSDQAMAILVLRPKNPTL